MVEAEVKEADAGTKSGESLGSGRIEYVSYKDERQLPDIMALIDQELSEPYSIFTYRYFITLWPDLCFLVSYLRILTHLRGSYEFMLGNLTSGLYDLRRGLRA